MIHLFLDACALARRYFADAGSRNLDQLFALPIEDAALITDTLAVVEAAGVLRATMEDSRFPDFRRTDFERAMGELEQHCRFQYNVCEVDADAFDEAMGLIWDHNLRGADAVHLALATRYRDTLSTIEPSDKLVLVTSDNSLHGAALSIGLPAFHFWQCKCPFCGFEFRAQKNNRHQHNGCAFDCLCGKGDCTSAYEVAIDTLLAL